MSGAGYAGTTPLGSELVKDALQRASSELDMLFTTLVRRAAVVSTANIQAKTHRRVSHAPMFPAILRYFISFLCEFAGFHTRNCATVEIHGHERSVS